jgi:hypothetical protein
MSEHKTCETCRFLRPSKYESGAIGNCRRYPPQIVESGGDEWYAPYDNSVWWASPCVEADEWCGEYQPVVATVPVSTLPLSVRARACVEKLGVQTIGDLAAKTAAEIMAVRNTGETTLAEILDRLAERGLTLGEGT